MKFFKWFFIGLGFWIILIMLITYPINTRAGAVSSVTLSDKTVTFYSPNGREEIYSLNVPYGETLQNFQNDSIVQNSAFSGSIDGWRVSTSTGSTYTLTFNDVSGFNLIYSDNPWFNIYTTFTAEQSSFYCRVDSSNPSLIRQVFASYIEDGVTKYPQQELISYNNHIYFKKINVPIGSLISLGFQVSATANNININYFYASYNLHDYFNSDYLRQLYHNAGYNISNLSWSESPYTSIPFSYNDPIEFNTNLYPSKVTESFSLTDSWQSLLTGLDKNYMTFNTFQDLVDTFQDLTDPNNLKINNVVDVFKALWFLLKSVFVLLYNVLMLIIAPFVDLFVMIISALFSGLDFWILI